MRPRDQKSPPHPGEWVRALLDEHGLNVTEGAHALHVSRVTLSRLVNGEANLSGEMAVRLSQAFGVRVEDLLERQFRFDLARRSWATDGGRADRIDTVANLAAGQLLPWDFVLRADGKEFDGLPRQPDPGLRVLPSNRLGIHRVHSRSSLFYDQAATVCHYLFHAEAGRQRRALLDYVIAYYTGAVPALDIERAFGVDCEGLGRATVAWAKAGGR